MPSEVLTQTTVFYLTVTYTGTAYPVTIEQTVTVMVQPAITNFAGFHLAGAATCAELANYRGHLLHPEK